MPDPEYTDIYRQLSVDGDSVPGGISRRRFLQGMLVAGSVAMVPDGLSRFAAAATPIGSTEGVLVVILMGGGNDGLNMVCPVGDPLYRSLRPNIAIAQSSALDIGDGLGLHPNLGKLKARFDTGKVAVVPGVAAPDKDHSHFSSMASWMAGTSTADRSTGWLGRYLDGVPEAAAGLRGVALGSSIPLTMRGSMAQVTAVPAGGDTLFGADRTEPWNGTMFDTISSFGDTSTGRGRWADALGQAGREGMATAQTLAPLYAPELPKGELVPQLVMAARLINANLGIRVLHASYGSFDTHDNEGYPHGQLLKELDDAVDAFYATLHAGFADQVTLMTMSEFGRRAGQNSSRGTDHGTSAPLLVIGDNVKGGLLGEQPALGNLDSRGDLRMTVDYRSVYGTVLSGWMNGDSRAVIGGAYPALDLFRRGPGAPVVPPPPPADLRWKPFATPTALVEQQYHDFLGRAPELGGVQYWVGRLTGGTAIIPRVLELFLNSAEFGVVVRPVARLALAATGGTPPGYEDLMTWANQLRSKTPLATIAAAIAATPASTERYGSLGNRDVVVAVHQDVFGRRPSTSVISQWTGLLDTGAKSRADLYVAAAEDPENLDRAKVPVDVVATYGGMLRRAPEPGGYAFWVDYGRGGRSLESMISGFFGSKEYANRFS